MYQRVDGEPVDDEALVILERWSYRRKGGLLTDIANDLGLTTKELKKKIRHLVYDLCSEYRRLTGREREKVELLG